MHPNCKIDGWPKDKDNTCSEFRHVDIKKEDNSCSGCDDKKPECGGCSYPAKDLWGTFSHGNSKLVSFSEAFSEWRDFFDKAERLIDRIDYEINRVLHIAKNL